MKGKSLIVGLFVGLLVFGSAGFAAADSARPPLRPGVTVAGEVTAIDDHTLTIATEHRGVVRVRTNTDTRFRAPDNPDFSQDDIEVGDTIAARGSFADETTLEARLVVYISPELADRAHGRVTAVDGGILIIENRDGVTTRIITSADTKFHVRGDRDGSIDDVKVGMLLGAAGRLDANGILNAKHVFASERREPRWPRGGPVAAGRVSQANGSEYVLRYPDGSALTITTDASTIIVRQSGDGPVLGTLNDVIQGSLIVAIGIPSDGGDSLSARAILVGQDLPKDRPRPQASSQP